MLRLPEPALCRSGPLPEAEGWSLTLNAELVREHAEASMLILQRRMPKREEPL